MTVKSKLILVSSLPILGLATCVLVNSLLVNHANRQISRIQNQLVVEIDLARQMRFDVVQIQQFLSGYSATRGQDGLGDGLKQAEEFKADFLVTAQRVRQFVAGRADNTTTAAIDAIAHDFSPYWDNGLKMAKLYAEDGTTSGNKFMREFDQSSKALTDRLEQFVQLQKRQLEDAFVSMHAANRRVSTGVLIGGLAWVASSIAFAIQFGRSASSNILRSVVTMHSNVVLTTSVARRISESSEALADGANSQAASIEETSSSLVEISSMTQRNSDEAGKANSLAKETRQVAERGVVDMREMTSAMETIKVSSDEISQIIKTIDEIAFQTNILALNAAVEAARAGTAGMGFAVVAEEVRNLAQRSAGAAHETAAKIESAIGNTTRGVELSAKVASTFDEIVKKARELDSIAAELANASNEQATGISQINEAVVQVDKVTQGNASSAHENAGAAKDLMNQTVVLKDAIEQLMDFLGENAKNGLALETKGKGVIQWNEEQMSTSEPSVDDQHKELIRLINAVHETVERGKGGDALMRQLQYLGEYATNHFAHEEGIMAKHSCPMAGKNKEAHTRFLRDYQGLVQKAHTEGPTPELAVAVKKLLGDWLNGHICKIDTSLRGCHPKNNLLQAARTA